MRKYKDLPQAEKNQIQRQIVKMHLQGYSQGEIAKELSSLFKVVLHKSQVNRILQGYFKEQNRQTKEKRFENIYKMLDPQFKLLLKNELLKIMQRKLRSYAKPKRQIFKDNATYFAKYQIFDEKEATEFISFFAKKEFGDWEKLEKKRRPASEKAKYHTSKGTLTKPPALIEIDATGLSDEGIEIVFKDGKVLYSFILIVEPYSGYIYPNPAFITSKTKKVRYYNNAFTSYDFLKLFKEFLLIIGKPKELRVDNDTTIKNKLTKQIYQELNLKVSFVNKPNQKFIERQIRDIKTLFIDALKNSKTEEEARQNLIKVIEKYNQDYHKFSHFNQKHIPQDVFAVSKEQFEPINEETLNDIFIEKKHATVRNNKISWDGYVYEFLLPERLREGDYGRKPKAPKVIAKRPIDNAAFLKVYDSETGEYLGEARLISSDVPTLDPTQRKALKNAEKRAKAKERKLINEINQINQEVEKMKDKIKEQNTVSEELLNLPMTPKEKEEEESLPSVFEILKGGIKDA